MKPKPLTNRDSVASSLFVKGMFWPLPFLCLLGLICGSAYGGMFGGILGVLLGIFGSAVTSLIAMLVSNMFGGAAAFIYRGSNANWNPKERLTGDLDQVRYLKRSKEYDRALLKTDEVLAKIPGDMETLYLKAGILWEGFNRAAEAKRCLDMIMKAAPETENYHLWASELYADITREQRRAAEGSNPEL